MPGMTSRAVTASMDHFEASDLALTLALNCVRYTRLEVFHGGTFPDSKTGDYSDVKVVAPFGEIPWNEVSRISDEEMQDLMREVVDKLYTALRYGSAVPLLPKDRRWDDPKPDGSMVRASEAGGLTTPGAIEEHFDDSRRHYIGDSAP